MLVLKASPSARRMCPVLDSLLFVERTPVTHIKKIAFINSERASTMNIYVGNLPYNVSDEDLNTLFAEYGEIETAKVIKDRYSGQSKGFGFVEMPSNSEADQAIKGLNGHFFNGRTIKVNPANPGGKKSTSRKKRY